ncbi:hypothetical protein AB6A40_002192 [Gnathostoma spinigerum]|uniref:Amidase domain-containing protein n=1 Tax=Gnathostoma spinigerum TaxID=75299 RepID=A0ABD6E636_9BILA
MGSCLKSTLIFISDIYFLFVSVLFWFLNVFRKRRIVTKPDDGLLLISATQAAEMIRRKEITSSDLLEAYIKRIEQVNGIINAVVVKDYTCARHTAAEIDAVLAKLTDDSDEYNELITAKPLLGVPFTVKDCIEVNGLACTAGLSCRKGTKAVKDAVVIERMRNSGAIILAVTNVPEVCMWWESFNSIYGRSSNPYDSRRITGGSSGGEAALISSAGSVVGIGSDIGGSIRMPSYFNGVFGLKPTPGIVPLDGHLPEPVGYRTEMLRIGPICRYAEDLTVMLKVLADNDGLSRILGNPVDLHGLRVFYMKGLKTPLVQPLSSDCENALRRVFFFCFVTV